MELYLKRKEVASLLQVSERSIKRYQNMGLKYYQFGRSVRYLEKDVEEFRKVIQKVKE